MSVSIARSIAQQPWHTRFLARGFASTRVFNQQDLAYDLHEPPSGNKDGVPILFLHGLFGSKRNNRAISKYDAPLPTRTQLTIEYRVLAKQLDRPIYALDLRNHGESPHDPVHNYNALSSDVLGFISQHALHKPCIIGHSMGAKTAMTLALSHPEIPSAIVAVDNAPIDASLSSDFAGYVKGMYKVADARVKSLSEADGVLEEFAKVWPVRFPYHLRVRLPFYCAQEPMTDLECCVGVAGTPVPAHESYEAQGRGSLCLANTRQDVRYGVG